MTIYMKILLGISCYYSFTRPDGIYKWILFGLICIYIFTSQDIRDTWHEIRKGRFSTAFNLGCRLDYAIEYGKKGMIIRIISKKTGANQTTRHTFFNTKYSWNGGPKKTPLEKLMESRFFNTATHNIKSYSSDILGPDVSWCMYVMLMCGAIPNKDSALLLKKWYLTTKVLELLLEKGVKVKNKRFIHSNLNKEPGEYNNVGHVELLLKYGVNINEQDIDGNTPLHIASKRGLKDIVEYLILNGADTKIENKSGRTALACNYEMFSNIIANNKKLEELLSKQGVDISKIKTIVENNRKKQEQEKIEKEIKEAKERKKWLSNPNAYIYFESNSIVYFKFITGFKSYESAYSNETLYFIVYGGDKIEVTKSTYFNTIDNYNEWLKYQNK